MTMWFLPRIFALCSALFFGSTIAIAQSNDPYEAIKEIAAKSTALEHIDTIYRLSEELAFWQAVALMGEEFDWSFSYNSGGTDPQRWTLRLENARGDGELEAKQAAIAISRSKYLTEQQKRQADEIFQLYTRMSDISVDLRNLLISGQITDAADMYESQSLELRRRIAGLAFSASQELRAGIKETARKTRP